MANPKKTSGGRGGAKPTKNPGPKAAGAPKHTPKATDRGQDAPKANPVVDDLGNAILQSIEVDDDETADDNINNPKGHDDGNLGDKNKAQSEIDDNSYTHEFMQKMLASLMAASEKEIMAQNHRFLKSAWKKVCAAIGYPATSHNMKMAEATYKKLQREYNEVKKLLAVEGFAWGQKEMQVLGSKASWKKLEESPKLKALVKWEKTTFRSYDEMRCIMTRFYDLGLEMKRAHAVRRAAEAEARKNAQGKKRGRENDVPQAPLVAPPADDIESAAGLVQLDANLENETQAQPDPDNDAAQHMSKKLRVHTSTFANPQDFETLRVHLNEVRERDPELASGLTETWIRENLQQVRTEKAERKREFESNIKLLTSIEDKSETNDGIILGVLKDLADMHMETKKEDAEIAKAKEVKLQKDKKAAKKLATGDEYFLDYKGIGTLHNHINDEKTNVRFLEAYLGFPKKDKNRNMRKTLVINLLRSEAGAAGVDGYFKD